MRKLFMAAAAVLACMTVNAQIWVGGSLGFNSEKIDSEAAVGEPGFSASDPDCSEISLDFSPVVGYSLNDKMDVGVELGFNSIKNVSCIEDYNVTEFAITPFARYKFFEAGKLSVHAQAQVSFMHDSREIGDIDNKYNTFNIGVKPLIKYALTDNIAIVSSFGWFGFEKQQDSYTTLDLEASSELSFGIYYAF